MANVLILGAAGKDFHVFNTLFRERPDQRVVAFTAAQIPDIAGRRYPPELCGPGYPEGIPIEPEADLDRLIAGHEVEHAVFAYSDVPYDPVVADLARRTVAAGADFRFPDVQSTMLHSMKPVVAVTAVRTGCGKSQTARTVCGMLREADLRVAVLRHPMPYGDLAKQAVQRFATLDDLTAHDCTIEEMEEYEPHIAAGSVVFAGVDYTAILEEAEQEADVIVWDGGNNDTPFINPDVWICVTDPLRPDDARHYYPGRENLRRADAIVINKVNSAPVAGVEMLMAEAAHMNPMAAVIRADSTLTLHGDATALAGKRVLAVEDGPTCTHGGLRTGAATEVANAHGAELVDPRPYLAGKLQETFATYPDIGVLLPAMGYGEQQRRDLAATIAAVPCDVVLIGTPIDLARVVPIDKLHMRVTYELAERGDTPGLREVLQQVIG